jgi:Tfp pilus assembly protein PilO
MKDYFELLSGGEKRGLGLLLLGAAAALALIAGLMLFRTPELDRTRDRLDRAENLLRSAERAVEEKQAERKAWEEARRDLEDLRNGFFYSGEGAMEALRVDIGRILSGVGAQVPPLKYGYSGKDDDPIKKITVSFAYTGSYHSVRRLLAEIEKFPRLLTIETVAFQNPGPGGILDLRLTLAGYHE